MPKESNAGGQFCSPAYYPCLEEKTTDDPEGYEANAEWKFDEMCHRHERACGEQSERASHALERKIEREATASTKGQKQ